MEQSESSLPLGCQQSPQPLAGHGDTRALRVWDPVAAAGGGQGTGRRGDPREVLAGALPLPTLPSCGVAKHGKAAKRTAPSPQIPQSVTERNNYEPR